MLKYLILFVFLCANFAFANDGEVGEKSVGTVNIMVIIPPRIDIIPNKNKKTISVEKNFQFGVETLERKTENNTTVQIFTPKL